MSLKKENNQQPKVKYSAPKPWRPNPWYERSEQFYQSAIIKGVCQFCKQFVGEGQFAVCSCPGSVKACNEFKRKIIAEDEGITENTKAIDTQKVDYKPNKTVEPEYDW